MLFVLHSIQTSSLFYNFYLIIFYFKGGDQWPGEAFGTVVHMGLENREKIKIKL